MVVSENSPMPSRATKASTLSGLAYRPATWRSKGSGREAGGSPPSCNMTPTRARRPASACCGSCPSSEMLPPVRSCRPCAHSMVVVLPAPLAPSSAVTAPKCALRLMLETMRFIRPSNAARGPTSLMSPEISRAGESVFVTRPLYAKHLGVPSANAGTGRRRGVGRLTLVETVPQLRHTCVVYCCALFPLCGGVNESAR